MVAAGVLALLVLHSAPSALSPKMKLVSSSCLSYPKAQAVSSLAMSSEVKKGHTAALKYSCEICGCSFARLKSLKEHEQGKQHEMNLKAIPLIVSSCIASMRIAEGTLAKAELRQCIASSYRGEERQAGSIRDTIPQSQVATHQRLHVTSDLHCEYR
eukprot:766334-Hanusia_phi.AAC.5